MRKDKNAARKLRFKGMSYNEISRTLNISKSTLSGWFSNLKLPNDARDRLKKRVAEGSLRGLLARNRNQTNLARERMIDIRKDAAQEIRKLTRHELKLVGAALYWAEGYKRPILVRGREVTYHPISLTNSDPKLIAMHLRFLREVCDVPDEQIHADLRLFQHMDEEKILKFWREVTGIPKKNFGKVYYGISKSSLGKRPFNRLPYGTLMIRVNNTKLFHRIMGWLEGLSRV